MHTVKEKKKESMDLVIFVDPTKIARGHMTFPKAGKHKDKRRKPKVAERVAFRKNFCD
mgnify:CR=1 FL=1